MLSKNTYGVSFKTNESLENTIGFVKIRVNKTKVDIVECSQFNSSIDLKFLKKETISCCFSSPSIITFQSEKTDVLEALNSFLPGVSAETFFIQKFENYYSIINQQELNKFLENKRKQGFKITKVFLEPTALLALKRLTGEKMINGENFKLEENTFYKVTNDGIKSSIKLDNKNLRKAEYLAFGGTIAQQVLSVENKNFPEALKSVSENLLEQNKFKIVLITCVGLLLGLTMGNFMYFSYLSETNKKLGDALYNSNASQENLEILKQQAQEYQKLKSGLNEITGRQGAYLLDLIGQTVPKEIIFNVLSLETPNKIREGHRIIFQKNLLIIEGKTTSTMALNKWIEKVSSSEWVKDVKLMSYEDNKEKRGNFKLEMFLGDV